MVEVTKPMPKLKKDDAPKAEPKAAKPETKAPKAAKTENGKIAAVLIRGREIGIRHDVVRALDNLKLQRRHICVVYDDTAAIRGLMFKCKDLITYGPISEETYKTLHEKRGSLKDRTGKKLDVFRMHPPRGGYRKGIKVSYQEGGDLGMRRKGMDEFLAKMM